ncbi:MAG TPA: AlpA family phage regulatory protein [Candidatus Margulisiibacteriota bacterium]|nr:AlpA family phage regulatory protein [Candidatus Margulisiibacteriota bacterium]
MKEKVSQLVSDTSWPISRLLRLPAVLEVTGLGRSTIYRMVADHTFPAPVRVAKRAVAWRDDDVRRWRETRPPAST